MFIPTSHAVIADRYELIEEIGRGGMGVIWRARQSNLAIDCAIKLIHDSCASDPELRRRFVREARAAASFKSPHSVNIIDVDEWQGSLYMAMELLHGETLEQRLTREGRLSPELTLRIFDQLARGLAKAHAAHLVHRDLKPENIFLAGDGRVKVLDFGLARTTALFEFRDDDAVTVRQSTPGLLAGTVGYMSPEQLKGESAEAASDLFSFGCVLYEMLAGKRAFDQKSVIDVLIAVLREQPPRLTASVTSIPLDLEELVLRCMTKSPTARIPSARAAGLALRSLLETIPSDGGSRSSVRPGAVFQRLPTSPGIAARVTPSFEAPLTQYTRSGDVNIAYQVLGSGSLDLVFVMGWITHLEYFWLEPSFARFLRRLASFSRLILIDKRGTGLSDRIALDELPTLEQRMDDVRAVMQAVGSERAALCGVSEGGPMCSLFAATYPDRTTALVMIGTYAKRIRDDDYPWAPTPEQRQAFFELMQREWGGPVGIAERAPSKASDPEFREWWSKYLRMGASPGAAVALTKMNAEIDVRNVLPTIRVPSLVIHRSGDLCLKVEEGRYVASRIPNAKYVELPGIDHLPFVGDQDSIIDEIEEFLTGVRHSSEPDRLLATILHVRAVEDGPALHSHRATLERELEWFRGRLVHFDGGVMQAAFDGPARAVRCADAIRRMMDRVSIRVAGGLHTGECDLVDDAILGPPLEIAGAVASHAPAREIFVTNTVRDLVAGSGLEFADADGATLDDLGGWRLHRVTALGRASGRTSI